LASRLHETRSNKGQVVGFLGGADTALLIANLAIIKAGQCLVVLNPQDPAFVLRNLAEHAGMRECIAGPGHEAIAEEVVGKPALSAFSSGICEKPFVPVTTEPDAIAVIQYTSGTTGKPKGALTTRAGLNDRWRRHVLASAIQTSDIAANFHPTRVPEQLAWLSEGATQHFRDIKAHEPRDHVEWLSKQSVTSMTIFAILFRQLAEAAADHGLAGIERLCVLGEPLYRADFELFNRVSGPGCQLWCRYGLSEYGPTAQFHYRYGDPLRYDISPIGKPLSPDRLKLIGNNGIEVGDGELGEIVVVSATLPGVYHNDEERSAATFKRDPDNPEDTLYFTGDLAYRNAEGLLIGLGRKDQQVKIRGYNVRPGDVEQILQQHPGVWEAAVSTFKGGNGSLRLSCHYVADPEAFVSPQELRSFLRERVTAYQIPSVFMPTDVLPRTKTGKLMRNQLPPPLEASEPASTTEEWPCTDEAADESLAAIRRIWQETLEHSNFGLHDDFFDIGGDSLQAMSVITAIEKELGVRVPLETLIVKGASVTALAEHVNAGRSATASRTAVLAQGAGLPPLFVTPVMGGHLSDYLMLVNNLDPRQPVIGLHPKGLNGRETPDATVAEVAASCAEGLRSAKPEGPYRLMGFSFGAKVAFELARLLTAEGQVVEALVLLDPMGPRDTTGKLARYIWRGARDHHAAMLAKRLNWAAQAVAGRAPRPKDIDEAHTVANATYQPEPLGLDRALIVSSAEHPELAATQAYWRHLIGDGAACIVHPGDHMSMVGEQNAFSLARKIEAWLGANG
jgi:acyl-coenzyme A synthetase/AMP-(fatty) acid ligase/thioesterase domain-containing protein/acyl carrier protein